VARSASPGQAALALAAAQRAQALGFPGVAVRLYHDLLDEFGPGRPDLTLALATALLDDERPAEADRVLRAWAGPRGSAWHLRAGLAAAAQRRFDVVRGELAAVRPEDLGAADRPWLFFLRGAAAAAAGDLRGASDGYQRARQAATTGLERARFLLADEEARLRIGTVSAEMLDQARQNMDNFRGTATGHDFAKSYAVMLNELGRKGEAVATLRRELASFQPSERDRADDGRLLLGLIGGAADGVGREALMQLLDDGSDRERQRAALQLLARASTTGAARASFRAELDRLIAAPKAHPIFEDLLLFRAAWALGDRPPDYTRAEADAHELLDRFPGSPLKSYAWGVLTASAWEQRRYRSAAADAASEQAETPAGERRAEAGVLRAEAAFRAGMLAGDPIDFRNAADAYAAALADRPAGVPAGDLMFQRVEAEMEAGSLATAERLLDGLAADPDFGATQRWRAEWNLARLLQIQGQTAAAYQRVNRLLAAPALAASLPAELRARMAWLQAQLSFDAGQYGQTLQLVAALRERLGGLPADLSSDIAGTAGLLEARADFELNREADGLQALETLRARYPHTDAAVYSYMIEAEHNARAEKVSTAQALLIQLAEKYPGSVYAPDALFQAALLAEQLGHPNDLAQANQLIEGMLALVRKYPGTDPRGDLVFRARLEQGNLLRRLNQFPQAQQTYELLRNDFPRHHDIVYALLALADCHDAQSANDSAQAESARALFEDLNDRVDAPVDVRVEAGYKLGLLLERRNDPARAEVVWWGDVIAPFLLVPARAAELGTGRYWMAKTLLDLGLLESKQGRLEEAKRAWRLVLETSLPFPKVAQSYLASLDAPAPKP
jgi:TolA-binding protein